jgi:multiple sugar transport system permease protein
MKNNRHTNTKGFMKTKIPYFFIFPAFVFFCVFSLWPVLIVLKTSFFDSNFITVNFTGFNNFIRVLKDSIFHKASINTLLYCAIITISETVIALLLALLSYDTKKWVQDYMRFALYLPFVACGIILSLVWKWIYHPTSGLLNWLIGLIGLEPIIWLGNRYSGIVCISVIIISFSIGFIFIVYLASMLSISKNFIEAAKIDGAGNFKIKTRIILPMILPTIAFYSLICMIGTLQIWETVFLMTNGGPNHGTKSIMFDIYETSFSFGRFGLACAKSIILLVIILVLSLVKRRLEKSK